jgi:hypothetical protein
MLNLSSTKIIIRRCLLVWLFIAAMRALLCLVTHHTFDNLFAAYLGHPPGSEPYSLWDRAVGLYVCNSEFVANLLAAATGLIVWIFLASLAYGVLSRRGGARKSREVRCRRCGIVLRYLAEPACPACGEAI